MGSYSDMIDAVTAVALKLLIHVFFLEYLHEYEK
jgi:hypothetical protein